MKIAGTGHRPKYCPCKYRVNDPWLIDLKTRLNDYLGIWLKVEPIIVRTGMAIGWDTWLAEVALEMNIELHAYVPFPNQHIKWPTESQNKYKEILDSATKINYTSQNYHPKVFLDRDLEMITGVEKVLSLLNPIVTSGGTYYTVKEAEKKNIEIVNFWID